LWTGKSLSISNLKGHRSTLLFVSPEEVSPLYENLDIGIHAMWHETDGHVYLVCNGSEEACRQLASDYRVEGFAEDQVPVILDEGGRLARSFLIDGTPQAVSLDSDLQVRRYGYPVPRKQVSDTVAERNQIQPEDASLFPTTVGSHLAVESADEETSKSEMKQPMGRKQRRCYWPDDRPYTGASFARMDTTVSCVLTRFRLRSAWSLIPFYLAFRRVRRSAKDIAGLLQAVFLIEDLHTCYTMSLWRDDCAIVDFGRVGAHITAANSAFGPTYRKNLNRAEIWSAQFRLWAVSAHNLNWDGLDMETVLGDQWARREEVARADFLERENANGR
jgi:hypothetical protein